MKIIILIILALIIILALFLYWSNKAIVLTRYKFKHNKIDSSLDGMVIAQVSDLQSTYFGRDQKNLLGIVKSSNPDIIVFTGDLMDRTHTNYDAAVCAMEGLAKIAPVYFVDGNHDLVLPEEDTSKLYEQLRQMDVHLLFDEASIVTGPGGGRFNILGMSESALYAGKSEKERHSRGATKDYNASFIDDVKKRLLSQVDKTLFTIMLAHEPQYFNHYKSPDIDLILSGHAHGGQIRLPLTDGLYAPGQGTLPKLTSGVHISESSAMIISRGLGNSTFPFRIFNRPEVIRIELEKE